jgi:hypothetical protein
MVDKYDGEDPQGRRDFEDTSGGKRVMDEILNSAQNDSEVFPEVGITFSEEDSKYVLPAEYQRISGTNRSILEGIIIDWQTDSPISPVPKRLKNIEDPHFEDLYGVMKLIHGVRDAVGKKVTEIDNAQTAKKIFTEIRRYTGLHMKDVFDSDWNDHNEIMDVYPYANMKFSINMDEGYDHSGSLTTFTEGNMTAFANSENIFWYREGLLLYASRFDDSEPGNTTDVFIFSDEKSIQDTPFHELNEGFYKSLRSQGRDHSVDPIMAHLRSLYIDNDGIIVKRKLNESINIKSQGLDSEVERMAINKEICSAVSEFSHMQNENLITDTALEHYIRIKSREAHEKASKSLNRGNVMLYKLPRE